MFFNHIRVSSQQVIKIQEPIVAVSGCRIMELNNLFRSIMIDSPARESYIITTYILGFISDVLLLCQWR